MNIAILVPTLTAGGAERAATVIGKHFSEKGHNVYYFLFANSGKCFFEVTGTIIKTHITYPFLYSKWSDNVRELFFASRSLKKLKKKYDIDVSISFMEAWNIVNICSRRGDRIIVSARTVLSKRTEFCGFIYNNKLLRILYNRSNCVVAVSEGVKNDLVEQYGIKRKKVEVISNPSLKHDNMGKTEQAWNYGDRVVLCVGRLDPVKQFQHIIRAFSYVSSIMPSARLVIVGDGRQMNYLKSVAIECNLAEKVIFAGAQSNIGFYLENARCFVMSSRVEGFPNVMVEAMAFGIPIVSTDSPGGCGEIVGKINKNDVINIEFCDYGVLTPYIDSSSGINKTICKREKMLGDAIYEMLSNEGCYFKYVKKSRERAKQYSVENIMCKWDDLLEAKEV